MSGLRDIPIPGLGVVTVTAASHNPGFEYYCLRCGEASANPMWWDASDGAWYCGAHGWVSNPSGIRFVYEPRVYGSPVWMPKAVGFDLEFELDHNLAFGSTA